MSEEQPISFGKSLLTWETLEFTKHERSFVWYIISGAVGIALLIYAILTASFPFAVIILMTGIIMLMSELRNPEQIEIHITTNGVLVGRHFYAYKEIKDFSIVYEPPKIKLLYLDFSSRWLPLNSIPLNEVDPNEIREVLRPFVIENLERDQESLTDVLARMYKL